MEFSIPSLIFTLFFVVDPIGLIPIFSIYLARFSRSRRVFIILKANMIAAGVAALFILFGDLILNYLGIRAESFVLAGGILLFLIAIDMLYERTRTTKMTQDAETHLAESTEDDEDEGDVSVFPLAIPFLSGPGVIAVLMMFTAKTSGDWNQKIIILLVSGGVFLVGTAIMLSSLMFIRILGKTGLSVVHRIMGLILAGLSIQFIVNGLTGLGVIAR